LLLALFSSFSSFLAELELLLGDPSSAFLGPDEPPSVIFSEDKSLFRLDT